MTTRSASDVFLDYATQRDRQSLTTNDNLAAISAALISIADSLHRIERHIDARENGA